MYLIMMPAKYCLLRMYIRQLIIDEVVKATRDIVKEVKPQKYAHATMFPGLPKEGLGTRMHAYTNHIC